MATGNEPVHPAAKLFPMMDAESFLRLVEDIRENGQREPIVYWQEQLLDGRNRLKACHELNITPDTCELDEETDPYSWVISANLHRRHLRESQRSLVAARLMELFKPAAKKRRQATQIKAGKTVPANLPGPGKGDARDQAAAMLNVSGRSVSDAAVVLSKGSAELQQAVESGLVSVSRAATVVRSNASPCIHLGVATSPALRKGIKQAIRESRPAPEPPAFDGNAAGERLCDWLRATLDSWPDSQRPIALSHMLSIIEEYKS